MPDIRFKVTEERTEILPLGVYRRLNKDPEAQLEFLAHYLVDEDGAYLLRYDPESGRYIDGLDRAWEILDVVPLRDIKMLVSQLQGQAEEIAVPKE